jgi:hypothetical protein
LLQVLRVSLLALLDNAGDFSAEFIDVIGSRRGASQLRDARLAATAGIAAVAGRFTAGF